MTTVLGIDPSLTNTGLAVIHDGVPVRRHSIGWSGHNGASYDEREERIVSLVNSITAWIKETGVVADLAVIEGPIYHGKMLPSQHDRAGAWWGFYSQLRRKLKVPRAVCSPTTRARWATGHGHAEKKDVLTTVRAWYPSVKVLNDDIADAVVLGLIGTMKLDRSIRMPFLVKERHYEGLEAVAWPQ